jgi:zinc protease
MLRKQSPPIKIIDQFNLQMPRKQTLENGVKAYFIKGGSQDIVKIEFLFKSGSYHQDKLLQACAGAHLLKNGTISKSSQEINQLWDFYGVSLQIEAQKDITSVGLYCLTRHLDPVLDLLIEIIAQPVFPQEELEIYLQKMRQKHQVNLEKVNHLARIHFTELLFGSSHPYGTLIKMSDFDQLQRADLLNYHRQHLHPANCVCFVAGVFPDNIEVLLNEKFRKYQWFENENVFPESKHATRFIAGKHLIQKESVQSSIRIGKLMIHRSHPDYHVTSIVNSLLGGFFGSRLMRNIRQDKGYTYGINSAVVALVKESYFFISSQVGNEVREPALAEVYHELKQLRLNPATAAELALLKNYLAAGFLRLFDGPFMQIERFKELLLFELDLNHFDHYLPVLNQLTPRQICETAERYFHEDQMLELVVGQ